MLTPSLVKKGEHSTMPAGYARPSDKRWKNLFSKLSFLQPEPHLLVKPLLHLTEKEIKNLPPNVILDTEWITPPQSLAQTVDIGMIFFSDDGKDMCGVQSYIYTDKKVDQISYSLHHLSQEFLSSAPKMEKLEKNIRACLEGRHIFGYGVRQDLSILQANLKEAGKPAIEKYHAHDLEDFLKPLSLQEALETHGATQGQDHQAFSDCQLTFNLLRQIVRHGINVPGLRMIKAKKIQKSIIGSYVSRRFQKLVGEAVKKYCQEEVSIPLNDYLKSQGLAVLRQSRLSLFLKVDKFAGTSFHVCKIKKAQVSQLLKKYKRKDCQKERDNRRV
jgi:DNA polymerase III epsilon subunit-like protein